MCYSATATPALGLQTGTTIGFTALAFDNYFSGLVSDTLTGMRFTPGAARFNAVGLPFGEVPAASRGRIEVTRANVAGAASTETGLLFMHRRNAGREANMLKLQDD